MNQPASATFSIKAQTAEKELMLKMTEDIKDKEARNKYMRKIVEETEDKRKEKQKVKP